MAQTHDWITPCLYGQPWFEKPVLYYWAAAVGFLFGLPAEWAARLPSALSALAAAAAIGWLGWKHYERSRSVWSPCLLGPLVFATSVAGIGFARAATPDMLFSALLTLGMASAACALRRRGELRSADGGGRDGSASGDWWPLLLFGVFLGLATLTKGPAAVLLAGGAMALWALVTRRWRAALRLAHPLAIAAFCIVALPWYVACALRNPDFLRVFIVQHNFERYLTPLYQHRQPVWFFLPIMLLALLPWTVLLGPVMQEGRRLWRERTWRNSPGFFFACWAIFPMIFFSLSQSKLPGYVLPSVPPLSLLCAVATIRAMKSTQQGGRMLTQGLGLTWFIVGLIALFRAHRISMLTPDSNTLHATIVTGGAIAILAGALMAGVLAARKKHLAVPLCLLCVAAGVEFLSIAVLPSLDPAYSARPYAELLSRDLRPERIFIYDVPRSWNWGLAFYFRRELPEWSPADPEPALALTTEAGFAQIKKLGRFHGELDEPHGGIRLVPVEAAPH